MLPSWTPSSPFYYPLFLINTLNTVLFQTCSIHCDVCVPFVNSSTTSGLLYCGWAEKNMTSSRDDQAIGVRWPDGDRTNIWRSPSDYSSFIHTAWSPSDHRAMITRWPGGDRPIFGNIFPRKIERWPAGHRPMFGRRPGGHRWMAKLPQESADHPANFSCELNLPDRRRMRAQGVLNRRMAVGFLQDLSQGSPHGDPAIEFAQLWRSYYTITLLILLIPTDKFELYEDICVSIVSVFRGVTSHCTRSFNIQVLLVSFFADSFDTPRTIGYLFNCVVICSSFSL